MKNMLSAALLAFALTLGSGSLALGQESRPASQPAKMKDTHAKSRPALKDQDMEKMGEMRKTAEEHMAGMEEMGEMPPMPEPSPEHKVIAQSAGEWDAKITMRMAPGAPPMTSTGVETNEMVGNFWLKSSVRLDFMGNEMEGAGILGFDTRTEKLFSVWTDSTSPVPAVMEGEADLKTGTLTFTGEMYDPMSDRDIAVRMTEERADENHRHMKMFMKDESGQEFVCMEIEYTRKK